MGRPSPLPVEPDSDHPTVILLGRAGRVPTGREEPPPPKLPQPCVTGYEILGEIGRGGMGVVYKARQLGLDRLVALKMLHAGAGCPAHALPRFRAEAEAIARLHHPNIIQVYEVGVSPAGPYFVLEFAGGGSLTDRLGGVPQPAATAARVVRTLARAVQHAHEKGIIHRDLKPANVLLDEGAEVPLDRCTLKIGDFGLARLLDEGRGLTLTGQVMGTPGYMPPEQARGPGEIGPPADVYSLGVLLYEMLTGRPPYAGETAIETLHLMMYSEPLPPSRLRRELPGDLETICLKCLDKEPARRYADGGALADDLDHWLAGESINARATPAHERAWKWVRRRPGLSAFSALAASLLVLAFALLVWQWRRAEAEHALSEEQRCRAVRNAEAEAAARAEAQRLSARLLLERGAGLCEKGDSGAGLLWLVKGLEKVPECDESLQQSIRLLLGGWGGQLHTLESYHRFAPPQRPHAIAWRDSTVAVACQNEVHFWDPRTRRLVGEPVKFPARVLALLSDSAGLVAAVRDATTLTLHRLPSGKALGPAIDVPSGVGAVALSPDGQLALVGGNDHSARLVYIATGESQGMPWPHQGAVRACAISPDGKWAVTGGDDREVRLWDVGTGELVRTMRQHKGAVLSLAFSRDGQHILSGGEDHQLCLWRRGSRQLVYARRHEHGVCAAAFHPDGELFATGSYDDTARLWQTAGGVPVGADLPHRNDVSAVTFSPDGKRLATAAEDGTLRVWNVRVPTRGRSVLRHLGPLLGLARDPRGERLLTACNDGAVRLWDLKTETARVVGPLGSAHAVAFHPDGTKFLIGRYDGKLRVYDAVTAEPLGAEMKLAAPILAAVFSPDGRFIATGCEDGDKVVRLWDWRRGLLVRELVGHGRKVPSLAFSPDGKRLLTASWDYKARLWDLETGGPCGEPLEHQDLVQGVAFGPDGKLALTGGDDYTARLWDAATGRSWRMPLRHPDKVQSVAFSPRGRLVATGGKGNQARLWEAASGKLLSPPLSHDWEVKAMTFDPEGHWLWTASLDGTVRRWPMPKADAGRPDSIARWVEIHTGKKLDDTGAVVTLSLDEWERRIKQREP